MPTIYLLEPINDLTLGKIVGEEIDDTSNSYEATRTALTTLTKKKAVPRKSVKFVRVLS